jgi:hypothetical protein
MEPGVVDMGVVRITPLKAMVTIPGWDSTQPPLAGAYIEKLSGLGLAGHPKLGEPAPQDGFQFRVAGVEPGPGRTVAPGTDVTVELYGRYARKVPDVTGLAAQDAVKALEKAGFKATTALGGTANKERDAYTVATQSVKGGAEHSPDEAVHLVIYGNFKAANVVPPLQGLSEGDARKAVKEAGLELLVMDRVKAAPEAALEGTAYQQEPGPKAKVGAGHKVKAWFYEGGLVPSGVPFYAAFQWFMPMPKEGVVPKRGENEDRKAYFERQKRIISTLPESQMQYKGWSTDKLVLPAHFSGAGLDRYPRAAFLPGEPYAARIDVTRTDDEGERHRFTGVILLKVVDTYDTLEAMRADHPALKNNEKLQALVIGDETGIAPIEGPGTTGSLGPLTRGWSATDKKEARELALQFMALFNCFVATAVFTDPMAHEIRVLRRFRDEVLLESEAGARLAALYYRHGPSWALHVAKRPGMQSLTRMILRSFVCLLEQADWKAPAFRATVNGMIRAGDLVLPLLLEPRESEEHAFIRSLGSEVLVEWLEQSRDTKPNHE